MKTTSTLLALAIALPALAQNSLKSPAEFLGYEAGEQFTMHHRVIDYFTHIDEEVSNAQLTHYGRTYEGRPLVYLAITSPANFDRLDEIRRDNLRRAGELPGSPTTNIPIIWMSYNVHGNEASSTEAAMETAYALAKPTEEVTAWLERVVVIIDPCLNPDGRDRYATFYRQFGNAPPNASYDAVEHQEPWPGGRSNHYLFDLNRDWAWLTQKESAQRIAVYNQWLPHIHIDFHEQGFNIPYYFAPAAEPIHHVITPWQRDFQRTIGRNNARYFDKHGWLYFTREVFDLYYPSYGDTYPTYNGAIGMTYEQAGGGAGGKSVMTDSGEPLTLAERIEHHYTSGMATIEVTARHADRLIEEFRRYFSENLNSPTGQYKTYLVKGGNQRDHMEKLTHWLNAHNIRYGHPAPRRSLNGFQFLTQTSGKVDVSPGDLVINVYQPRSRFITAIFEPQPPLPDSLTYDITAWNPFYAMGLDAWALQDRVDVVKPWSPQINVSPEKNSEPYAYIFRYRSLTDVAFLSKLINAGFTVRSAVESFSLNGESFEPGTLVVTRRNNEALTDFDATVQELAREMNRVIYPSTTGLVESGADFGSRQLRLLHPPRIATAFGDETSSLSSGEVWHFFEQQIGYPVTQIRTRYLQRARLENYDVLVVPEGYYTVFDDALLDKILVWVRDGGRLVVIGNAMNAFVEKTGYGLTRFANDEERKQLEYSNTSQTVAQYRERERRQVSETISGAVYKVDLDSSHPLSFGVGDNYYTLKTHGRRFAPLDHGWNVSRFGSEVKPIQGFAGYFANQRLKNSLQLGVYEHGRGHIVYFVDNPLFRGFWENGKMLFSNALFMIADD